MHSSSASDQAQLSSGAGFTELNAKVFNTQCLSCHGPGMSPDLTSYATLMAGTTVRAADPNGSALYLRLANGTMPPGAPLPPETVQAVYDWIRDGAPGPGNANPPPPTPSAPADPTSVMAAANSATQITISWTDNSGNEEGFVVERALTPGGPFTIARTAAANVTSLADTGLNPSTTYYYRVYAYNSIGNSGTSGAASATTQAPPVTLPAAPSLLMATSISSTQINLTWTDNSDNEAGFYIERSANGMNYTQIADVGPGVTNYSSLNLTPSTTYNYRVRAYNAAGSSPYSNTAGTSTQDPPVAPAAPSNLTAAAASSTQINLAWTDNSGNEDGFYIERSPNGTTYTQIASVGSNTTAYSSSGLTASTTYYYRVRAFNSIGASNYTTAASAMTQAPPASPPAAPSGLAATAVSSTQINLSWNDNSNNETEFAIERSLDGTAFTQIATVAANTTSYSNTGLSAATQYAYRVRALNAAGNSNYSNTSNATTQAAPQSPAAPTALSATAASSTQINLAWTDNSNNETGFYIERSADGSSFTQIAAVGSNVSTYSNTGLTAATVYYYRVRSYSAAGNSNYSNSANAMTQAAAPALPAAPSGLTLTPVSATQVNLAWTDNSSNESNFVVERATAVGGPYTVIATLGANTTSYSNNTGLSAAIVYYYRVAATNAAGMSSYVTASAQTFGTWTWVSANIFQPRCVSCHGPGGEAGYNFSTYASTKSAMRATAAQSRPYTEINSGSMPPSGGKLPAATINALKTWIDSGAADN